MTKFASAHDLRRAFGTRWGPLVKPAVLQAMMRHSSNDTTLSYYVDLDADDVADELWKAYAPTPGNSGGKKEKKASETKSPKPL